MGQTRQGDRGQARQGGTPINRHGVGRGRPGLTLDHPRGHHSHSILRHQLHADPRPRVAALQVVDELCQVCWVGTGEGGGLKWGAKWVITPEPARCVRLQPLEVKRRGPAGPAVTNLLQRACRASRGRRPGEQAGTAAPSSSRPSQGLPPTLDGVDVMMGRRGDEAHAGGGVAGDRDVALPGGGGRSGKGWVRRMLPRRTC